MKDFLQHPLTLLTLLGLSFFADLVLHPDQVLYADHSDLLTLHLPSKVFLVRSWQETGELPLWDPYSFSGLPFVHDTQVSAFYPLHLPLYLLPVDWLGAALGWLILLHVIAAGWCMYGYARVQGLEKSFAFVAGMGYMFAGKWLIHVLHAGHYNMLPLAWLPLLLCWQDEAIRRRSLLWASLAGGVFALFVLCAYPYVTLYVGLFVALWSLGAALFDDEGQDRAGLRTAAKLGLWLGCGVWMALVGVALGAVQLLPSLEAAPHTTRSLGVEASSGMIRAGIESLMTLTGRAVIGSKTPAGEPVEPQLWEYEGGIGVLWLALAVIGLAQSRGKQRFYAAVAGVVLVFALGGGVLLQWLPGFRYFRLQTRMLLLLPLPLALLSASALQRLLSPTRDPRRADFQSAQPDGLETRPTEILLKLLVVLGILQGGNVLMRAAQGAPIYFHLYWCVLPFTTLFAFYLLGRTGRPDLLATWAVILLLDLWTLTGRLVMVKPWAEIFTPSQCVQDVLERTRGELGVGRIMARYPPGSPLWLGMSEVVGLESIGGFNPTDVRRYKEYVQFITDVDEPLQPPQGNFTFPVLESFPVKNERLLNLLGVRYLMQPSSKTVPPHLKDEKPIEEIPHRLVSQDPAPHCFDMVRGGLMPLPPYAVYEYERVMPRAFVVPEAKPLPREGVLATLKATDFRRTVLLEDFDGDTSPAPMGTRAARITQYRPNRVVIDIDDGPPGYLVLADIWFPGWSCTIDGATTPIHRANYVFRGVALPAGRHEVIFQFAPRSYALGKIISGVAAFGLALLLLATGARMWLAAKRSPGF